LSPIQTCLLPEICLDIERLPSESEICKMAIPPNVAEADAQAIVANDLHQINAVTETQLGEHEGLHDSCAFTAGGGPGADEAGVPPWFGPALAAALAAALQPIQDQLNNFENNFGARMDNIEARQFNSMARDPMDPLRVLTNKAGVAFADFPPTFMALMNLTGDQLNALLNHYGLDAEESDSIKFHSFKMFIGMRS
jgi:hypothetical protein